MKSKLLALLLTLMMCCSMLLLASCGGGGTTPGGNGGVDADDTTYSSVYDLYVAYAEANGITPDSYEVWLETITGADGVLGVNGIALEIRINGKTNDWEISYNGGTLWTSLGFKAATANIVGVVDIKFSSIEEDGKIYLIVDYFMSNNTSSSMRIEIGTVGGGETPDQPGEGGGETPDQPGEGGGETPDQPGEGGGETPDQPGEGEKVSIVSVELLNSSITYDINSTVSFSQLLAENGTVIKVSYSDGTSANISITPDMFVSGMDQDVSVPGTYEFGLNYTDENGNKYDLTLVIVSVDNGQGGEGGEDNPPSEDIENVKKEALSAMDSAWETLGDWADLDNYAAAYSELRAKVEGATTNDEINSYMNEFNALCETIFGELKVELADELADVWAEFSAMGDVSAYEPEYAAYCNELQAITNIDDLIALVDEVNDFLDEVYEALNGNEGGEDGKPTIVKVELINGTVTYEIGSNISFSELLNKNGTAINIMYSDGTGKATFITPDMFATGMDQNINVPGTYEFGLVYTDDNGEKYKLILVVISVDNGQGGEDNEDITGNYKFVGNEFFSAAGFAGVEIYADGTLSFLGTDGNVYPSCNYVLLYDNVIVADFYGQLYMVISIDTASKTADFYTDTKELPLIGEYKLYMGDETMVTTFSVYEVTVYGMNLTYAYGPIGSTDAGVTFTYMTILCGLDLDEGILNYGGQDFIINEDNTLTPEQGGGEDHPDEDISEHIGQLVKKAWNEFYSYNERFGSRWEAMYYEPAKEYIYRIESSTSIEEAEMHFKELLNNMMMWAEQFGGYTPDVWVQNVEVYNTSAVFTQGVTAAEVIEWIVNNVCMDVYYSDGKIDTVYVTYDMIRSGLPEILDDINSTYYVQFEVSFNGYYVNREVRVSLEPDLSDAELLGTFARAEDDFDYLFEFAVFTVYDNGIVRAQDYDGYVEYFEYYEYSDKVLYINLDGVDVYYSLDVETGTFTDFVYSEQVIGEYNVLDEGITLIFTGDYAGSGYYFVKYGAYVTEELFDFVTIEMYLDLESGIIIFLEQEMGIFEDGVTVDTIVTDERKEKYASYLINEWNNYCSSYDLSELKDRYEALLAEIDSLKYNHELDKWRDAREEFLSDLYNLVNGSEGEDKPIEVYLVKAYLTGWSVSVPQYADYSSTAELLNANGISVCYEYSDGSRYYGPITEDMVTLQIDTSVAGSYVFAIEINTEAGMFMGSVSVEVIGVEQPDVPDIDTTTYTFSENTDIFYSLVLSNSSNSGTLNTFEGGIQIYYNDCGEYFEVDAGVATFLFAYDKEGLTVFNYAPDYSTASSYYLKEDDTYMLFDVLGEYYGADWYVCNYYASVGEIEARCTIKVWLDLESSILRTADFDEVTFIINPDRSLSFYGSGSGEDNIEEIQYLAEKAWDYFYSYVDKFGYEFENKYGSAFKEYYSRIKSASSYEEAKMYYSEFCLVCKTWADEFGSSAVPSINYIELNSESAEFLLGVTASEVIDWILSNVTATVYFSDGSEEVIAITYDMIRNYLPEVLDELDRYYEVGVELSYNGYNYSYDYIRIVISPDLSGASVLGSYKRAENDMDYCFGFAAITIYDNGIILVEDYDGDSAYAEFGWYLDNVITVNVDSVDVYYSFDNETGIFTDYVPEGEVIGKYTVYDEGITLIFVGEYTGAGDYFVLYGLEEGDISDFVTIKMYLDMESCRIIFLEQELIILEDNTIVTAINEESRKDARKYLVEEWEYNSQYYDLSELQAEYDELLAMLDSFKYQHELYEWYDMREEFLQKLYNIVNNSQPELPKDFYIYVETLLNECHNAWWDYVNRYGYAVEDKYAPLFNKLIDNLQNADSYDEVYKLQDEFENLFDMIESNFGGMDSVYVQDVEINKQDYDVVEGTSFDEFIKLFLETSYLTLYYSDGHSEQLAISYDMLSFYNGTVDTFTYGYDFHFGVNYDFGNTSGSFGVSVTVNPDMSNATLVGTFVYADGTPDPMTSIVKYEFYDNGMFIAYSLYGETATVPYIFVYDNVIGINVMGSAYALYSLDFENGYISSYAPVSEVYAKYTLGVYEDLEICPAMTIYNERNAEGAYVATIEGWADPSMKMWVSITMLVTIDDETGYIYYAGQPMVVVDGVLMPAITDEQIENQVRYFENEWKNLSSYRDVSAYVDQYKTLMEALKASTNYLEYEKNNDALWQLMNEIRNTAPNMGGDMNQPDYDIELNPDYSYDDSFATTDPNGGYVTVNPDGDFEFTYGDTTKPSYGYVIVD